MSKFDLSAINTGAITKPPRIILLGQEKIGKTTFACGSQINNGQVVSIGHNSPIVIPIRGEEGADGLAIPKFPTVESWDELLQAIEVLGTQEHNYQTVVLDSASALEPLIWEHVCAEAKVSSIEKVGGGYAKGYTEAFYRWQLLTKYLDALRDKGMATIVIGHVEVKRFDDPSTDSYDHYIMSVHKSASALLYRWADCMLFASTKISVKKEDVGFNTEKARAIDIGGGNRYLFTQKSPAYPAGGRGVYGHLPAELPLDWTVFEAAVGDLLNNDTNN